MAGTQVIVLMGVSGCGKTSVGIALADKLGWAFYDGDDFHPPANVAKMAHGIPLTDADRWPWLDNIRALITQSLNENNSIIIACSALKEIYRQRLSLGDTRVRFIYLRGTYDLIWQRMQVRQGHYMQAQLLQSQFDALEEPDDALLVDINAGVDTIVEHISDALHRL